MASTQYQIFCRYLNENINRPLTNQTDITWISAERMELLQKIYNENKTEFEEIKADIIAGNVKETTLSVMQLNIYTQCLEYESVIKKIKEDHAVIEYADIRPDDDYYGSTTSILQKKAVELDQEKYQIVIDESVATNPKYDMVFMYDGVTSITGQNTLNPTTNNTDNAPYMIYERMKRIKLDPWFLYSSHSSLQSAMTRAKQLVNILGKNSVKIGKVVSLDQYIDII